MKSKIWSLGLIFFLFTLLIEPVNILAQSVNEFDIKIITADSQEKSIVITGYRGADNEIYIPDTIDNLPVIGIGYKAFSGKQLKSVTIPNSVLSIEAYAFYDNQLTNITIGENLISIWDYAFASNRLHDVYMPESVLIFGENVFLNNKDINIAFPVNITSDGLYYQVFLDDNIMQIAILGSQRKNKNITIPDTIGNIKVTFVGDYKNKINIEEHYGLGVFQGNGIEVLTLGRNLIEIQREAFANNKIKVVAIPDSVANIGVGAFQGNGIEVLTLGRNLIEIQREAFANNKIKVVVIPDSVTKIEMGAFQDNEIEVLALGGNLKEIVRGTFANNKIKTLVIPDSVTEIDYSAFANNEIENLILGKNVTSIKGSAFENNNLTSIIISDRIKFIGAGAFCENRLKTVLIGSDINIEDGAFSLNHLEMVSIGNNVSLGTYVDPNGYVGGTLPGGHYVYGGAVFGDDFFDRYESNGRKSMTYYYKEDEGVIPILIWG